MKIGIIGLPNVGKSTLFNALLKKQVALAANYPFATIEPNIGVVEVPDERLDKLAELVKPEKVLPAVVEFVDIAGLVKGAAEGEGLGNKFLSHIREVDALVHVLRAFEDENIARAGSIDSKNDREIVETELALADLQTLNKRIEDEKDSKKLELYKKLAATLNKGELANTLLVTDEDKNNLKELNLLTVKPVIQIHNISESALGKAMGSDKSKNSIQLSAKIEMEIASLPDSERVEYMSELGIKDSGLDIVIKTAYNTLGLQTFFTAGPKEVRAWAVKEGLTAPQAAGKVHTDFERGFISAVVVGYEDFVNNGGLNGAKQKGLVRVEGKNYVLKEGEIVEFRFNV